MHEFIGQRAVGEIVYLASHLRGCREGAVRYRPKYDSLLATSWRRSRSLRRLCPTRFPRDKVCRVGTFLSGAAAE